MKKLIVVMVVLIAVVAMGATLSWRGSYYASSATTDYTVDFDGKAEKVTNYAPDGNIAVVYYADGDTIIPADVEPGSSDAFITYPAGVPSNEFMVRADSMRVVRTDATEVFTYWR
jgi:hypothetical protein